ncbi:FAD-dependent oxidoreductase [Mycobacterium botniense]|uniref:D-amino-acid oxidase n=1 Tax=Mycobacterium botniense TaxID=84962 RepID=A0A7I9Y1D9_9MYCO|nr:FAD-dependent oxidoreductase [Mycobacterium botniense]GFG75869.1 amino acid oxidase [Mycobacterium botniense]
MASDAQQAVVVGAGVSGLTTGVCLAEAGWAVQVWTAARPQATTSMVAGAVWSPVFSEPVAKTLAWTERSLREFRTLSADPSTGVRMASALIVGGRSGAAELFGVADARNPVELPPQARLVPDLRPADPTELPDGFEIGFHATMPLVDMPRYLGYLSERLTAAGGEIETHPVRSLAEAADAAPIVINCAGLGARALLGDDTMRPVFGQHVVLTNPGLERLFLELTAAPEWICYFPHPQRVVCGGIRIPGRWDTTADPEVTERILQRCRRIEPRLADAEVIETITGLRPDRPAVRVAAEPLGRARCIHNYGHGSSGVTLSWGCAHDAAHLAADDSRSDGGVTD